MPIDFVFAKLVWVKRESGENPERSRHCVRESAFMSLRISWEENVDVDRSQETCLVFKLMICGLSNLNS